MTYRETILKQMKETGISSADLASELGANQRNLETFLSGGEVKLKASDIVGICQVLGLDTLELYEQQSEGHDRT